MLQLLTTIILLICSTCFISSAHLFTEESTDQVKTDSEEHAHLTISKAWARSTRQKAYIGAAYLDITNSSEEPELVTSATSSISERIELHTHIHGKDDTVKMVEIAEIPVPAKGQEFLKPGGIHLMFFGLKEPFETGKTFHVELTFQSGAVKTFPVLVGGPASKDYEEALKIVETGKEQPKENTDPTGSKDHNHQH